MCMNKQPQHPVCEISLIQMEQEQALRPFHSLNLNFDTFAADLPKRIII